MKRYIIIRRDRLTCQQCGTHFNSMSDLTVHHIVPRLEGGSNLASNLITLCPKCHDTVECDKNLSTFQKPSKTKDFKVEEICRAMLIRGRRSRILGTFESDTKDKNVKLKVKCEKCGREFVTTHKQKHYVCKHCKTYVDTKSIDIKCEICGKVFTTAHKNAKYCSTKCSNEAYYRKRGTIQKCEICGKEFYARDKKQRFCSVECRRESRMHSTYHGCAKTFVCPTCGKVFESNNYNAIYCSKECRMILYYKKKRIENVIRSINELPRLI